MGEAPRILPVDDRLPFPHPDLDEPGERVLEYPQCRYDFVYFVLRGMPWTSTCASCTRTGRARARSTVADLRLIAGRYPGDPALTGLIGELTAHSSEFAKLWGAHTVCECGSRTRVFHHLTMPSHGVLGQR
jgi:hypothetical protein